MIDIRKMTPCNYKELKEYVEYKKVSFVTEKKFPDNSSKISVKQGFSPIDEENKIKLINNKRLARLMRYNGDKNNELSYLSKRANLFNYKQINDEINEKKEALKIRWYNERSLLISLARSKKEIIDILHCNKFDYFVTVTFDKRKINRFDDNVTRKKFQKWLEKLRQNFPNCFSFAVPEYHKKGGLHFHLLLGGVSDCDLKLVDSGKRVKKGYCKGDIIYNITRWKCGFSTVTKIRDIRRAKWYIMKYLRKQSYDVRFMGKKRYWVSRNIIRPKVTKYTVDEINDFDNYFGSDFVLDYRDFEKQYYVFVSNDFDYNI